MADINLMDKLENFKIAVVNKKWNPRHSMQNVTFCLKVQQTNERPRILWEKKANPTELDKSLPCDIVESINDSVKDIASVPAWKLMAVLYETGYSQCVMVDGEADEPYVY